MPLTHRVKRIQEQYTKQLAYEITKRQQELRAMVEVDHFPNNSKEEEDLYAIIYYFGENGTLRELQDIQSLIHKHIGYFLASERLMQTAGTAMKKIVGRVQGEAAKWADALNRGEVEEVIVVLMQQMQSSQVSTASCLRYLANHLEAEGNLSDSARRVLDNAISMNAAGLNMSFGLASSFDSKGQDVRLMELSGHQVKQKIRQIKAHMLSIHRRNDCKFLIDEKFDAGTHTIEANPRMLRAVLFSVLDEVCYTAPEGSTISFSLEPQGSNSNLNNTLTISCTGKLEFSQRQLQIKENLSRGLDLLRNREGRIRKLKLWVANKLMKRMSGNIEYGENQKRSVFTLSFPRSRRF